MTPVDIASLVAFRILFGSVMAVAMLRFLAKGWVNELYVLPKFHLPYDGFSWVHPLPAIWMHLHFLLLALLAIAVAIGFCYRAATLLFCIGFTYVELIDQTAYLNHYYLVSLLAGLLIFLPAHAAGSVDAWRDPTIRRASLPAWNLQLLRFQLGVVYVFAGIAKLNPDWLLHAQPLRIWLAARSDAPWIGPWLEPVWVAYAASWFGAIYDLTIVLLLLQPRTRRMAFGAVLGFHVGTWLLFNIGMFPWIMITATTLFFQPDWPRLWLERCRTWLSNRGVTWRAHSSAQQETALVPVARPSILLVASLALYASVQVLLPLRPYLGSGAHPAWSYHGFNLAWQVMVAEKSGYAEFQAREPATGQQTTLRARDYLTPRQESLMAQDPFLIRALARKMSADLRGQGWAQAQIFVNAFASLNGRPRQRIIDPRADLATAIGSDWLLLLEHDLTPGPGW